MAKIDFSNFDPAQLKAAQKIAATLKERGFEAVFAGGCVRDALLGRPLHDIDIATSASPDEVERIFCGKTVAVGKSFGIIVVRLDGISFDVATFRADSDYTDGRHPGQVSFVSAEEDAWRRDFTVNALFCDPLQGEVIDYTGGMADLEKRVIRAIGEPEARFAEDHLRMLRAVRFAAVLGFNIDPDTVDAIRVHREWIDTVSAERVASEFTRMLCESPVPSRGLKMLLETGMLKRFLPEVAAYRGVRQPPQFHPEGDVWNHVTQMLDDIPAPRSPELAWAVLLHDIGKPKTFTERFEPRYGCVRIRFINHADVGTGMAREILLRLKMPTAFIDTVCNVVANHMRFINASEMRGAKLRRFMGTEYFPVLLAVIRLDLLHSNGDLRPWKYLNASYQSYRDRPILPEPIVKGRDLIAWGVPPGKKMGGLLTRLYDAQLEGKIDSPESAKAFLEKNGLLDYNA
ncbi:MAG: HD domain-containing protein [Kiritimatiellae bacterium]|nr:HD domain-containing protein [Kiritimatiellia bacterium]